jgi:hypothetical protein
MASNGPVRQRSFLPDAVVAADDRRSHPGRRDRQSMSSVKTACGPPATSPDHRSALSDRRREFACRLLESRAELHDVRDFLGHANITTTSRYLKSTTRRLERALTLPRDASNTAEEDDERSPGQNGSPEKFPIGSTPNVWPDAEGSSQGPGTRDLIEDVLVSLAGIEPFRPSRRSLAAGYGRTRGQWRAMRHGIAGILGNRGIVESVTYRI